MIQQLILLTDSVAYGKKIQCQVPSYISQMKIEDSNQRLQDFVSQFLTNCSHFGMFNKQLIALELDEEVFMNSFFANEKYQEVCLCIEDVVVVAKSAFFTHRLVVEEKDSLKERPQLPINSINLIALTNRYENVETVRQLICFLVSALTYEQNCGDFLSQQLSLIDRSKELFVTQVKQLIPKLEAEQQDEGSSMLESCIASIRQHSDEFISNISLFTAMRNLYNCANNGHEFEYSKLFSISPQLKCTDFIEDRDLMHKTVLFTKRRAKEQLGHSYTKRFDFVLTAIDSYPTKSLEELGVEYRIAESELRNAANILIANNLGMLIHPVQPWSRYSICLSKRHCATQFEQHYKRNYLQTLKEMQRSCTIEQSNVALFLLINGIVRQCQMYVFVPKKPNTAPNYIRDMLAKYSLTGTSLSDILRLEDLDSKQLVKYLAENSAEVLIYMTE